MRTESQISDTRTSLERPLRRRSWLLIIPVLTMLGITGGAYTAARAQTAEAADAGQGGDFHQRHLERLLDKVNATASQRSQIEAIWSGLRPQLKSLHQQEHTVRQQIQTALSAATINASSIEQLRKQSMTLADQLSSTFTSGLVQTAQVLTPDQRKQAAAAIEQARSRFHQHHGSMGGPAGGPMGE